MSINHLLPPSDEGGGTACRDGGRENALIKPFLTTPQSPTATAPLTRGAENRLFRQTECSSNEEHFGLYLILIFIHIVIVHKISHSGMSDFAEIFMCVKFFAF